MAAAPNKTRNPRGRLCAAGDLPDMLVAESDSPIDFAASGAGEAQGPRKFSMMVYSGGLINPAGFAFPAAVELSGMTVASGKRPVLYIHDQERPVGHTTKIEKDSTLRAEGVMSVDSTDSQRILISAGSGFPWKSSMGIRMHKVKFYEKGESFTANGKQHKGPAYHVLESTLHEVSFVTLAGDDTSSASIAAKLGGTFTGAETMKFQEWLKAKGFDPETITDSQREFLQAMFDQEQKAAKPKGTPAQNGGTAEASAGAPDLVAASREAVATELDRHAAILQICAQYNQPQIRVDDAGEPVTKGGKLVQLQAHAVRHGWDATRTELCALRASRTEVPAIHSHGADMDQQTLEAAVCLTLNPAAQETWLSEFGEQRLEAAGQLRNLGLRELAAFAARMEGIHVPAVWGDGRDTLRAAFTTTTLPAIFENVMNKTLLPIFEAQERIAPRLCRVARTSDFKQTSRVRLLGSGQWEKVGADGQLKHGRIDDEKFTNQVDTFGQYVALTREDWINDDLGALDDIARYMAIMGNQVVEDEFFRVLLAAISSGFFHTDNGNVGAGVVFGVSGLSALKTIFRKIKAGPGTRAANKRPINVRPAKLLVPVELEDEATSLIGSANLMMEQVPTSAASKTAPKNPHFGRYEILSAPQISDSVIHSGATAAGYWLFSDSNVVAAFELAFLNGISRPTIERVEAPPNYLGMGFRGYIDFGIAEQDPRGAAYDDGTP